MIIFFFTCPFCIILLFLSCPASLCVEHFLWADYLYLFYWLFGLNLYILNITVYLQLVLYNFMLSMEILKYTPISQLERKWEYILRFPYYVFSQIHIQFVNSQNSVTFVLIINCLLKKYMLFFLTRQVTDKQYEKHDSLLIKSTGSGVRESQI